MEKSDDIIYISIISDMIPIDVYKANIDEDPIMERSSVTPDFSHLQKYLDEPHGMNIRNSWKKGNTGGLSTIRHIDFGVNEKHEDLQGGNITIVVNPPDSLNAGHGTASVGCISAANNGFGVTGIAYSSKMYTYYANQADHKNIMNDAKPGDIISASTGQIYNNQTVPSTASKDFWDTVNNMTQKGVIVILAAGNSGIDLGKPSNFPDYGDSGAILVGACEPETGRRSYFSNYGHSSSLINSWGYNIVTTAYGDLYKRGDDTTTMYAANYNGTSGATPLCAGALALLQSYAKSMGFMLNTQGMKKLLSKSSYTEGVADGIGVRPNVAQLMYELDKEILSPLVGINPFPHSANYVNHNIAFNFGIADKKTIFVDYSHTDMPATGAVVHYPQEGPTELTWFDVNGSNIKLPIIGSNGKTEVLYLKASKINLVGEFSINSGGYESIPFPGGWTLALKYLPEENTHLTKDSYSGILPLYIKSIHHSEFKLPFRINIFIE